MRGTQDHDECPRCGESESVRHVFDCKGTGGADSTFVLAVTELETGMVTLDTTPSAPTARIKRLQQWIQIGDQALPRFLADCDQLGTQATCCCA
jgi:hypothetical protein